MVTNVFLLSLFLSCRSSILSDCALALLICTKHHCLGGGGANWAPSPFPEYTLLIRWINLLVYITRKLRGIKGINPALIFPVGVAKSLIVWTPRHSSFRQLYDRSLTSQAEEVTDIRHSSCDRKLHAMCCN